MSLQDINFSMGSKMKTDVQHLAKHYRCSCIVKKETVLAPSSRITLLDYLLANQRNLKFEKSIISNENICETSHGNKIYFY